MSRASMRIGGSQMRRACRPRTPYQRVTVERRLHDAALHAASAAVHEPHFARALRRPRRRRIRRRRTGYRAAAKACEIEFGVDGDVMHGRAPRHRFAPTGARNSPSRPS